MSLPPDNDSEKSIDLSKMSMHDYSSIFKRVNKGTPAGAYYKIATALVVAITVIFGLGSLTEHLLRSEKPLEPQVANKAPPIPAIQPAPNVSQVSVPTDESKELAEKLEAANQQLKSVNEEKAKLKNDLEKKPSYGTCLGYERNAKEFIKKKDEIEDRIQLLLNPPLTQQQLAQGMAYTAEQLSTYVRQASEYRKAADDVQRQLLAVQELRKQCE